MTPLKCCVGGCDSTSETHRLFSVPKDDELRKLWIDFIVPTNPLLIGLSKEQLLRKRVCHKHFERCQLDGQGRRTRYSYPSLFTAKEIAHGVPLSSKGVHNALSDHNYYKKEENDEEPIDTELLIPKNEDEDLTDPLLLVESARSAPIKPVSEQIKTEIEDIGIFTNDKNDNSYGIYIQEFPKNKAKERQQVKPQENKYVLPQQPLEIEGNNLKRAAKAKRLKMLKSEVIRQRQIIESMKEKLNKRVSGNGTAVNPRYEKETSLSIVTKNMTEYGKIFTRMQCYQSHLKPHARRFNMKEKVLALSIFKTSPKCYRLLSHYFAMPSTKCLYRLLAGYTLKGNQSQN